MGGRPFPIESWMTELDQNFHRKLTNGEDLVLLIELEIGFAPNLFSIEADHIDPCLTDEQKHNASSSQGLKVLGFNKYGQKWNLQLRKENGNYFFIEETGNQMTAANGWEPGTEICIWGAPGGIFRDGKLRFLFTDDM